MQKFETVLIPELTIQNTVSTAEVKQEIDITSFNEFPFLSSNLKLYACGYVKDKTMKGKVTVFRNGKLISVGTKSPKNAEKELKKAIKILENYNFIKSTKISPKTRNIVGRFDFGRKLPIESLARKLPKCMYEPEQFAALIYRIQGSCVGLLFSTGKGIIVGAKSIEELNSSFFEINSRLSCLEENDKK